MRQQWQLMILSAHARTSSCRSSGQFFLKYAILLDSSIDLCYLFFWKSFGGVSNFLACTSAFAYVINVGSVRPKQYSQCWWRGWWDWPARSHWLSCSFMEIEYVCNCHWNCIGILKPHLFEIKKSSTQALALWLGFGFWDPKPGQSHLKAKLFGLAWPGFWPEAKPCTPLWAGVGNIIW